MATIRDVAAEARVSIATVSKILNNPGYGSAETRARVMAAIKRLGYRPNSIARSMIKGKTGMIALVIPDVRNPFFTSVARGVEDVANKYDYRVILCNTDENPLKEKNYLDVLRTKIVDGVIIAVASEQERHLKGIDLDELPFVFIDRECPGIPADTVVVDNKDGAYKAVSHLISLGHTRIGLIAGKRDTLTGRDRVRGYVDAHGDNGLVVDQQLIKDGGFTIDGGYQATRAILALERRPTALFVSNNAMTIGCLKALSEAGIRIPEEISIVGFDDSDWAAFFTPPLSVVEQPTYTMGTLAGEILFQRMTGSGSSERKMVVLKPELVVRKSCGTARKQKESSDNSPIA